MGFKRSIAFSIILLNIFFYNSCERVTLQDNPLSEADSIRFSRDILPIFAACTGCHDGLKSPNLKDNPYTTLKDGNYVNIVYPTQSILYVKLKTDNSHSSRVSPDQLQKILQWIKQGARNN